MKKLLTLGLILSILTVSVSAQAPGDHARRHRDRSGRLTVPEAIDLKKDQYRYHRMEKKARRDGVVTKRERKRLRKAKKEYRREEYRYRHN